MNKTITWIAMIASALLLTSCGNTTEKETSGTAEAASSVTEAESAEPEDEDAPAADDDPFDAAYWQETERLIPETYGEDFVYNGVTFKTMADVIAASGEEPNLCTFGNQVICFIENDEICTRFIANMSAELTQQHYELDIFDDDYQQKEIDLVKDLKIARIDDLKAGIPSQEELNNYIGSTVKALKDAGFEMNGCSVIGTKGEFTFSKEYYEFIVSVNEQLSEETDYFEGDTADSLTVKSMTYSQLSSNASNIDDLFEESEAAAAQ